MAGVVVAAVAHFASSSRVRSFRVDVSVYAGTRRRARSGSSRSSSTATSPSRTRTCSSRGRSRRSGSGARARGRTLTLTRTHVYQRHRSCFDGWVFCVCSSSLSLERGACVDTPTRCLGCVDGLAQLLVRPRCFWFRASARGARGARVVDTHAILCVDGLAPSVGRLVGSAAGRARRAHRYGHSLNVLEYKDYSFSYD